MQQTLFAFDCGATNWRLSRVSYKRDGPAVQMLGEPQASPLTSFADRRLPAILLLNPAGTKIEAFGELAQEQLEDEQTRSRLHDYFKPCIGSHLIKAPLPHQVRYTHAQALHFTEMLLGAVLAQLKQEKLQGGSYDENLHFAFAYPIHWGHDHDGIVLKDFQQTICQCFPEQVQDQLSFVSEPEAALLSLHRQGLLTGRRKNGITLVADVGGSTTDMIAGRVDPDSGHLEFARRYGEAHGGGLYDSEIAKYLADELKLPASVLADDPSAFLTLREYARQLKETLSRQLLRPDAQAQVPKRTITLVTKSGETFRKVVQLDEATFSGVTRHLSADFEYLIENCLKSMGLRDGEAQQVVLVGGGGQLFSVVRHLRKRFGPEAVILADNPAEIVVLGAALEYGRSVEEQQKVFRPVPDEPEQESTRQVARSEWELKTADGQIYPLSISVITIGRRRTNQIWLKDDLVSREHAEVRLTGQGPEVIDLGSSNGTFLNGKRLAHNQPTPLQAGDKLKIGQTEFTCAKNHPPSPT